MVEIIKDIKPINRWIKNNKTGGKESIFNSELYEFPNGANYLYLVKNVKETNYEGELTGFSKCYFANYNSYNNCFYELVIPIDANDISKEALLGLNAHLYIYRICEHEGILEFMDTFISNYDIDYQRKLLRFLDNEFESGIKPNPDNPKWKKIYENIYKYSSNTKDALINKKAFFEIHCIDMEAKKSLEDNCYSYFNIQVDNMGEYSRGWWIWIDYEEENPGCMWFNIEYEPS